MKTKKITVFFLIFAILFAFCACDVSENTDNGTGSDNTDTTYSSEESKAIATINAYLTSGSSTYSVLVSTGASGTPLTSKFNIVKQPNGYSQINYRYEEKATFIEGEDGKIILPASPITVKRGSFTTDGKTVKAQEGDAIDVDLSSLSMQMHFSESNFTRISLAEGVFSATIANPDDFFGSSFDGTNPSVRVAYTDQQIITLSISYTSKNGFSVTTEYAPAKLLDLN